MPAAMEERKSTSGGSKSWEGEEEGVVKSTAEVATPSPMTMIVEGRRSRRPNVRLGEIRDYKVSSSRSEITRSEPWITYPRKSNSANGGKSRTKALASVSQGGEANGRKVPRSEKEEDDEVIVGGAQTSPVVENTSANGEEMAVTPGSTGRKNYGGRGRQNNKRKRASNIRSSTIAKTLGVVNQKAKRVNKVLDKQEVEPVVADEKEDKEEEKEEDEEEEVPAAAVEMDMEEESGAVRAPVSEEEHAQNGDTEVIEDDGNGEHSSGRQEGTEADPESPGVRENHIPSMNGVIEPVQESAPLKDDRENCTSRLIDGDKKNSFVKREGSMNGRRGGVGSWLGSLGLDKYADLFEENEVDNDVLPLLTFEDLKEMGIAAVGARRKMYAGIQELRGPI